MQQFVKKMWSVGMQEALRKLLSIYKNRSEDFFSCPLCAQAKEERGDEAVNGADFCCFCYWEIGYGIPCFYFSKQIPTLREYIYDGARSMEREIILSDRIKQIEEDLAWWEEETKRTNGVPDEI